MYLLFDKNIFVKIDFQYIYKILSYILNEYLCYFLFNLYFNIFDICKLIYLH